MQVDFALPQSAILVRHGPVNERLDVLDRKRLKLEHAAAADQRAIDREERIFGRGADEDHDAVLDVRQEHILLGLVEAVDFVDEQQCPLPGGREPIGGLGDDFPQFLHTAGDGADLMKMALRGAGQEACERGFARAGRAVEDDRPEPIGRQQSPQQFPFAEKVLLPDELIERPRPHPRRQGLGLLPVRSFAGVK